MLCAIKENHMEKDQMTSATHSLSESSSPGFALSFEQLSKWRHEFYKSPINCLAQNVATTTNLNACLQPATTTAPTIAHSPWQKQNVEEATSLAGVQSASWICAGLDLVRLAFLKQYAVSNFEFSSAYILYWHKLERCNYFLQLVVEQLERCEPLDGRKFRYLMKHAVPDAGNWAMFVNLVAKYGLMPKQCYLVSASAVRTLQLNRILRSKLHEYACRLHAQFTFDNDSSNLHAMIEHMMQELFKTISISLGTPAEKFDWEYYDKKKHAQCMPDLTAKNFYELLVRPHFNLEATICLGHDPRLAHSYQHNYCVLNSSNMVGGQLLCFNNQPMEMLMQIIIKSLQADQAVWLACDMRQNATGREGDTLSLTQHNFELVFGFKVQLALSKAERLLYRETGPSAALLLTGVTLNTKQEPMLFRAVCRSSGPKAGKSRQLTADWLREHCFQIVVLPQFVPAAVLNARNNQTIRELPVWDVLGCLLG